LNAGSDVELWELPPKPKWMRWRTFNRYVKKFDAYEEVLRGNIAELLPILNED
jgi:hypothetical protein